MVNFLFFNGDKIKNGRAPGNALVEPASARWNQGNFYTDNPLHGLWKWEDNRVMSSAWFLSGKYAYYNTGFTLESIGPLTEQMGISPLRGQTFGSTNASYFTRPQHTVNVDSNYFKTHGRHDARVQVRRRLAPDRHLSPARSTRATAWSRTRTRRPTSAPASIARAPAPTARRTWTSTSATRSR